MKGIQSREWQWQAGQPGWQLFPVLITISRYQGFDTETWKSSDQISMRPDQPETGCLERSAHPLRKESQSFSLSLFLTLFLSPHPLCVWVSVCLCVCVLTHSFNKVGKFSVLVPETWVRHGRGNGDYPSTIFWIRSEERVQVHLMESRGWGWSSVKHLARKSMSPIPRTEGKKSRTRNGDTPGVPTTQDT